MAKHIYWFDDDDFVFCLFFFLFSVDFSSSQQFPFNQPKCSLQTNTILRAIFIPALSVSSMHMCLSFSQLSRICRIQNEWNKWQIKRSKRFTLRKKNSRQFFRFRSVVYSCTASQSCSCILCEISVCVRVCLFDIISRFEWNSDYSTAHSVRLCSAQRMPCLLKSNVLMKRVHDDATPNWDKIIIIKIKNTKETWRWFGKR